MPQTIETPSGRKRELPKVLEKIPVKIYVKHPKKELSAVPSKVSAKVEEDSTALKVVKVVAAVPLIPLALLSGCNPFEEPKEKDKSKEFEYVKPPQQKKK